MSFKNTNTSRICLLVTLPLLISAALPHCAKKKKDSKSVSPIEEYNVDADQDSADTTPDDLEDSDTSPGTKDCVRLDTNLLKWTKYYSPDLETPNRQVEGTKVVEFRAGPLYGLDTPEAKNVGYTDRSGTISSGAPSLAGPKSLECSNQNVLVAWKYSNNVAGLQQTQILNLSQKIKIDGRYQNLLKKGTILETFLDPKEAYPLKLNPRDAYYNDSSRRLFLTSTKVVGSQSIPFELSSTTGTSAADEKTEVLQIHSVSDKPLWLLSTFTLSPRRQKLNTIVMSGELVVNYEDGLQATLLPTQLALGSPTPGSPVNRSSCQPYEGTLETRYVHPNKNQVFWVKEQYGTARDNPVEAGTLGNENQISKIWFGCEGQVSVGKCADLIQNATKERYLPRCLFN